MKIAGVTGAIPQRAKPAGDGAVDMAKLEQQKKYLQDEIKRVKEDEQLAPEAKEKKLKGLEKKLRETEQAIQKASTAQKPTGKDGAATPPKTQGPKPTATDKNSLSLNPEEEEEDPEKRGGEAGKHLDVYL